MYPRHLQTRFEELTATQTGNQWGGQHIVSPANSERESFNGGRSRWRGFVISTSGDRSWESCSRLRWVISTLQLRRNTQSLFRGHTGFEAQDGHQIRVHSRLKVVGCSGGIQSFVWQYSCQARRYSASSAVATFPLHKVDSVSCFLSLLRSSSSWPISLAKPMAVET